MHSLNRIKVKLIKKALIKKIEETITLDDVKEWLWEDFGIKVKSWNEASKFILRDDVTISDIITFLLENDIEVSDDLFSNIDEVLKNKVNLRL
ncbi:MAG: hypothetical protein QXR02_01165 [Acidilobaceae archaeon]